MPRRTIPNWLWYVAIAVIAAALLVYGFYPTAIPVDVEPVRRGPLRATIDEDGKTRIREKYVVSSPLNGRLARVALHAGDVVIANETILAVLDPTAPSLLDVRARAEAEARLKAAEATKKRAETVVLQAQQEERFAKEEFERGKPLVEKNVLSHEELDRRELHWRSSEAARKAAELSVQIADHELSLARVATLHLHRADSTDPQGTQDWRLEIRAPISGRVLRVLQESSAVVNPGTPLIEIGDPADLEVIVDVLSSDAVKIQPGHEVILDDWGGSESLQGRVRYIEPAGFTKVSALGVEEQRVNVVLDLVDPPERRRSLGDQFRVLARIVVEQVDNALVIPSAAVFRSRGEMFVFVPVNGRLTTRFITIGRRGRYEYEVTSGLSEGEQVVVYPSDKLAEGVLVEVSTPD